jgi:hypothetical protein
MVVTGETVRVFVSSTFDDMCAEQNALQREVWPDLRTFCEGRGARFQAIDLCWGISDEATRGQPTVDIRLSEVRRCLQVTERPNMVMLPGQRYGGRALP